MTDRTQGVRKLDLPERTTKFHTCLEQGLVHFLNENSGISILGFVDNVVS